MIKTGESQFPAQSLALDGVADRGGCRDPWEKRILNRSLLEQGAKTGMALHCLAAKTASLDGCALQLTSDQYGRRND
jgi:hypothetical protein